MLLRHNTEGKNRLPQLGGATLNLPLPDKKVNPLLSVKFWFLLKNSPESEPPLIPD